MDRLMSIRGCEMWLNDGVPISEDARIVNGIVQQLLDTLRENERLRNAIGNLEPLRDFDWHGKWRIVGCLDALSNKDSGIKAARCPKCGSREFGVMTTNFPGDTDMSCMKCNHEWVYATQNTEEK